MTNIKKAGEKSHPFVDYYINIRRIFSIKLANLSRKFANLSRSFPSSRSAGVRIDSSKQVRRIKVRPFPCNHLLSGRVERRTFIFYHVFLCYNCYRRNKVRFSHAKEAY